MKNPIDLVFDGYKSLTNEEKIALVLKIKEDIEKNGVGNQRIAPVSPDRQNIKKGVNLGPVSRDVCPCCGK